MILSVGMLLSLPVAQAADENRPMLRKRDFGEEFLEQKKFERACNPCRYVGEISFTDLQRRNRATVRITVIATYKKYKKGGWHERVDRINVSVKNRTAAAVLNGAAYLPALSYRKIEPPQGVMVWFPDQYRRKLLSEDQSFIAPGKTKEYALTFDEWDIHKSDETPLAIELWEHILKGEEFFDLIINPTQTDPADLHAKVFEIPIKKISSGKK